MHLLDKLFYRVNTKCFIYNNNFALKSFTNFLMFQTVNSVRLNIQRSGIRKLEFVASDQFLSANIFSKWFLNRFFHVFFFKFRSKDYKQKIDVLSKMFLFMGINWIAEVKLIKVIFKAKYVVLIYTHSWKTNQGNK